MAIRIISFDLTKAENPNYVSAVLPATQPFIRSPSFFWIYHCCPSPTLMYNCVRMYELSKKCFVLGVIVFVLMRGSNGQDISEPIERIYYNMADLMALRTLPLVQRPPNIELPPELKVRKRGKKGSVKARTKRRGFRPVFPTIAISNARSINNKTNELQIVINPCIYNILIQLHQYSF